MQLAPAAQRIAAGAAVNSGRFNLDDLGAKFSESLAGERSGDELPEFENLDPFQRLHAGRLST